MDPITAPTVAPTGDQSGVNLTLPTVPVNPAQAPQQQYVPPSSPQQQTDVSGLIANYENRLRDLMSKHDKMLNERNASINAQAQMQQQLTQLQESATTGLSSAVDNAQRAINENTQLRAQVQALQADLVRFRVLAETPDLLPYTNYIPAGDEAAVREHVKTFQTMREQDLARFRPVGQGGYAPSAFPGVPAIPQFTPAGTPALPAMQQVQPGQQQPNIMNLYQNRPTMAPPYQQVPGSQPALMNPNGGMSASDSINTMLREAREKGPDAFNAALEQAKVLAVSDINQQIGRV